MSEKLTVENRNFINLMVGNKLPTWNQEEHDATMKKMAEERAVIHALNKTAREARDPNNTPRNEFSKLRREQYNLKQDLKGCEVRLNEKASDVHEFEKQVASLLIKKQAANAAGQLGDERKYEHLLIMAEDALMDARDALEKLRKANNEAVRALKDWNFANEKLLEDLAQKV